MGNKATSPYSQTENIQNSSLQSYSGLHLFKVHFPTFGAGVGLVILGAVMPYFCIHRYCNRSRAKQSRRSSAPNTQITQSLLPPHNMPTPSTLLELMGTKGSTWHLVHHTPLTWEYQGLPTWKKSWWSPRSIACTKY